MRSMWLFGVGLICAVGALVSLTSTHANAQRQVNQILVTDQTSPVPTATMMKLQSYVADHMGAGVTFRLNGAYERDLAAAKNAASSQPSGSIYQQAQAACASIKIATQQAACNEAYLQSHLQASNVPAAVTLPNIASYTYTLKAPSWTPDLSGLLLAAAILIVVVAAFKSFGRR